MTRYARDYDYHPEDDYFDDEDIDYVEDENDDTDMELQEIKREIKQAQLENTYWFVALFLFFFGH